MRCGLAGWGAKEEAAGKVEESIAIDVPIRVADNQWTLGDWRGRGSL